MTHLHKFLLVLLFAFLVVPMVSFAAFDDVTLTTDAVITAGGINLTVSGSSAVVESITVDTDRFFFTLLSGSSLQVTSSDKKQLTTSAPVQYITTNECGSSSSILKLSSSDNNSTSISVTPQSATCGNNATSAVVPSTSSSSSGGGGGGVAPAGLINPTPPSTVAQNIGIPVTKVATVPMVVAPTPTVSVPFVSTPAVSAVFNKILSPGKSTPDVKRLQQLLNSDPDTRITASGVGSPGKETTYFGALTVKAIKKFQVKYGIAKPGDAGYGLFGPKTRAKIQKVFGH